MRSCISGRTQVARLDLPKSLVGVGSLRKESQRYLTKIRRNLPPELWHSRPSRAGKDPAHVVCGSRGSILRYSSATNFELTPRQAARLEALWRRTGRDWSEEESTAALWAYARTRRGEVSKQPDSPVTEVAVRIGRATSGV
jgi:hypothetical protein